MKISGRGLKRRALSFILTVTIALGAPATVSFADGYGETPENNEFQEFSDYSEYSENTVIPEIDELNAEKSDRRLKYEQLLEGNYFAPELIQKFHELFGSDYTAQYIRENYTEIFDVGSDEIDEGLLNIIANVEYSCEPDDHLTRSVDSPYISDYYQNSLMAPSEIELPEPPEVVYAYPDVIEQPIANAKVTSPGVGQNLKQRVDPLRGSSALNGIDLVSKTSTSVTF